MTAGMELNAVMDAMKAINSMEDVEEGDKRGTVSRTYYQCKTNEADAPRGLI
jgi:hypothetical protein